MIGMARNVTQRPDYPSTEALGYCFPSRNLALLHRIPDRARRRVRVLARVAHLADAARERAHLEGVPGVVRALALLRPAGAVVVRVLARAAAHAARDGTVHVHEARVRRALALLEPVVAVGVDVDALRRADAAARRAVLEHVVGVALALALLRPLRARLVEVGADVRAHAARVRADRLHVLGVVASALAVRAPRRARAVLVVAEADGRGSRGGECTRRPRPTPRTSGPCQCTRRP